MRFLLGRGQRLRHLIALTQDLAQARVSEGGDRQPPAAAPQVIIVESDETASRSFGLIEASHPDLDAGQRRQTAGGCWHPLESSRRRVGQGQRLAGRQQVSGVAEGHAEADVAVTASRCVPGRQAGERLANEPGGFGVPAVHYRQVRLDGRQMCQGVAELGRARRIRFVLVGPHALQDGCLGLGDLVADRGVGAGEGMGPQMGDAQPGSCPQPGLPGIVEPLEDGRQFPLKDERQAIGS